MELAIFGGMLRLSFVLVLLLPMRTFGVELGWWPELVMLYEADLAIDADLVRYDDDHFWVRVGTVLRDTAYGIGKGDHIRVKRASAHACGFEWRPEAYGRYRLYLQKDQGKGNWSLKDGNADCAIGIGTATTTLFMPKDIVLPVSDFNRCLLEFQTCYAMNDTGWTFHTVADEVYIHDLARNNPIITEFERVGRTVRTQYLFEEPPYPATSVVPEAIGACSILEVPPSFGMGGGPQAYTSFVDENRNYPETGDLLEGVVYMRVLITVDGRTEAPEILRGMGKEFDKEALRLVGEFPNWSPGMRNGVAKACYEDLPIRFTKP